VKVLGFMRRLKDTAAVVQTSRHHDIKTTGPYRTPKGATALSGRSSRPFSQSTEERGARMQTRRRPRLNSNSP
jgi:hypothetical protein